MLIGLLALRPGDRVLDVGCGRAQFLLDVVAARPVHGVGYYQRLMPKQAALPD